MAGEPTVLAACLLLLLQDIYSMTIIGRHSSRQLFLGQC